MYRVILVLPLLAISIGATNPSDAEAKIVEHKNKNDGHGNYFFRFVTSNGITREETGRLINSGQPDEHVAVEGFFSYNDADGFSQTVYYKADANGYLIISPPLLPERRVLAGVPDSVVASLLGK